MDRLCVSVCVLALGSLQVHMILVLPASHIFFRVGIDIGTTNSGRLVDVWESYQGFSWFLVIACQSCATYLAIVFLGLDCYRDQKFVQVS